MDLDYSYKLYSTSQSAMNAMYEAILMAKKSIFWEIYIFEDDVTGTKFIDALCAKARNGIEVRVILDGMGSFSLSALTLAKMKKNGIDVRWYHRIRDNWRAGKWWQKIWYRNHRKLLIVDEQTAFLGGVNVSNKYTDWDDLYICFTGRIIRPLLKGFAKTYVRSGGKRKVMRHLLYPKLIVGLEELKQKVNFIWHSPLYSRRSSARRLYLRALASSRLNFNLLTPYYSPDLRFFELLARAKKRGVEVNLFIPRTSDVWLLNWVAKGFFDISTLLGANVYLLPRMNHGKGWVSDNTRGYIGTANFTPRSWFYNEEVGVSFQEENMVNDLNNIFLQLKNSATLWSDIREEKEDSWWGKVTNKIARFLGKYV